MFNFPLNLTKNTLKEGKKAMQRNLWSKSVYSQRKTKQKALRGSQEIIDY